MSYMKEMFEAVSNGDMDRVETLAQRPDVISSINKRFPETGQTLLTEAARKGQYATIEFLLPKGADPSLVNDSGQAPIHLAAYAGDERVVRLLHEHGAKIDVLDEEGKAPAHWATRHNQKKVLEYLVANGADVNLKTSEGNTCLQESILGSKSDIVSFLLKQNPQLHHRNNRGEGLLYSAARAGRDKVVEKLLSLGLNFNAVTNNGETVLYESCRLGHMKVIEYLFYFMEKYKDREGIDIDPNYINIKTTGGECEVTGVKVVSEGWTALHVAVGQGHYDVVKYLLEKGAKKDIKNADKLTPEDLCYAYRRKNILPLFLPPKKIKTAEDGEDENMGPGKKKGVLPDDWRY